MSSKIPELDLGMGEVFITGSATSASPDSTQEITIATEQEGNTTTPKENKATRQQDAKTSRAKEVKKPRPHEIKKSRGEEAMTLRFAIDAEGHVRSPHNITMRDDYYRALQQLALDRGSASRMWLVLDEAVGQYLDSMGRLTPSGRVKR